MLPYASVASSGTSKMSVSREPDAEQVARLLLDIVPGCEPARAAFEQAACIDRLIADAHVLPQKRLVRRVRRIRLVLIDERRRFVVVKMDVVGRVEYAVRAGLDRRVVAACEQHETLALVEIVAGSEDAVRARDERIIRLQRNVDRAVAALVEQVESVIEKLPEQRHPGVERCRHAGVGLHVRDLEHGPIVRRAEDAVEPWTDRESAERIRFFRSDSRGIARCLVGDQVRDDARIRIDDVRGRRIVRIADHAAGCRTVGVQRIAVQVVAEHLIAAGAGSCCPTRRIRFDRRRDC